MTTKEEGGNVYVHVGTVIEARRARLCDYQLDQFRKCRVSGNLQVMVYGKRQHTGCARNHHN